MPAAYVLFLFLALASLGSRSRSRAIAGDCPLDFSWSNISLASSACANQNERGKCCRYLNAIVAISIAQFANATGRLGVPPAVTEGCLSSIPETLSLYGIPASASVFCGLGSKIRVSYQCQGRETVLEMMQSPNFSDVIETCNVPLSLDNSCKRCLNSGIIYLHHLIATDDNITLSVCRDAVFVTLANQGGNFSAVDMAACFFGVQGLSIFPVSPSGSLAPTSSPKFTSSPSSISARAPRQQLNASPMNKIRHTYHLTLVPGIGVGVIGLTVLLLLVLILLIRKKSRELKNANVPTENSWNAFPPNQVRRCQEAMFRRFAYKEMKKATENFSTVIGKGGFGTVYKAQFVDGPIAAVKRMDKVSKQGEEEFCREIELLARLHHRHLVALKGFCAERNERFLVYEYMENGSLKDHLHSSGRKRLSWRTRLQIAIDVANALEYLHFYCDPPLCHRDIKSSNILLDEKFVAKVADFGLAHASRSDAISFEPVNTDIRGTPGYMDPEYVVTQELTEKSDIYSYGVLLLELVSGRRAIHENRNLVEWSQKFLATDSRLPELVDPATGDSFDFEQLHMVVELIKWCTHKEGRARPSIKQVLRVFSEHLDPVQNGFSENEEGDGYVGGRSSEARIHRNEVIPYSGDVRCLQSSSSTSRSYCSRSVLLESGSPQSPPVEYDLLEKC
ncbi:probable receptor-like protein kinase At1g49730 isoform X2 [Musa acuminata AAA Group]|uniref:probable receptor-like protein kinase At1g49730 isoform X2 n=1 Tax=Musa acuminata AAA Group TaxID=214697 RepID=UPI0031E37EC9